MTDRAGARVGAALVPVLLVAVDPWGWYPFGPLRWAATTTVLAAAVALLARPGWVSPSVRGPLRAGAALVVAMAVTALVGRDPIYAWTGTPERHAGVLLWVVCLAALVVGAHLGAPRHRALLARGLVVAAGTVALLGVAEAVGWEPRVLDVGDRLTGAFGSSAYLGAVCALLLPVGAGLARSGVLGTAWSRAAAVVAAGLVVPLVGSGARSAWLGLALAAGVGLLARRRRVAAVARQHPARAVAATGALVVAVALVAVLSPAGSRATALADADAAGGRSRLDEWRVAARVLSDHPVLGVGPEGYRTAFAEGVDAAYERAHGRDPLPDRAHSAPLDVALAGGIAALLAWAAWAVLVARRCWWALRDGDAWAAGLGAALVAHLGGQLTLFPLAEVEPVAWLLAGALCATAPRPRPAAVASGAAPVPATAAPEGSGPGAVPTTAAATTAHRAVRIGAAALAVVALVAGVADVVADRRAREAADALSGPTPAAAVEPARAAVRLRPDTVRLHLLLARARLAADEGTLAALDSVDDAARLSPRDPIVARERLRLLVRRAAATEVPAHARTARDEIAAARARDPFDAELWLLAGEAALLDADPDQARQAWARAEDLAPRRPEPPTALALLAHAEGRQVEAEAALDRARALAPEDPAVQAAARVLASG